MVDRMDSQLRRYHETWLEAPNCHDYDEDDAVLPEDDDQSHNDEGDIDE